MAIICGLIALLMGLMSFVGAIIRGARDEYEKSHNSEMGAIGWFILAAVCFK